MKKWILLIIIPAVACMVYFGLFWMKQSDKPDTQKYYEYIAQTGSLESVVDATGRVVPNLEVEIKCKASGTVVKVPVDYSDRVKKGDLLLELDPKDEQRNVSKIETQYESAKASVHQAEIQLDIARKQLVVDRQSVAADFHSAEIKNQDAQTRSVRFANLFASKAISREEYDTMQTTTEQVAAALEVAMARMAELEVKAAALEATELNIDIAKTKLREYQIALDVAQQNLIDTRIVAPWDGVVTAISAKEGQIIASAISNVGGGTATMKLADLSRIFVVASVDESDIGMIRLGQKVRITVDAFPQRRFFGVVERIGASGLAASNVVSFDVKVEIVGDGVALLKPEMTANVQIVTEKKDSATYVPTTSLNRRLVKGDGEDSSGMYNYYLMVRNAKGDAEERLVEVGINTANESEIVTNLKPGETVLWPKMGG